MKSDSLHNLQRTSWLVIGAFLLLSWTLYPIIWFLMISFTTVGGMSSGFSLPEKLTFASYEKVLFGLAGFAPVWKNFMDSFIIAFLTSIIVISTSLLPAYAASRFSGKIVLIVFGFAMVLRMLPDAVMGVPFYLFFGELGLLDNYVTLSLAISLGGIPLGVWILKGFIDTIPREIEEQAQIDGASQLQVSFKIVLPLIAPGLAVTFFLSFMAGYQNLVFPLYLSRGEIQPISLRLLGTIGSTRVYWNEMAALTFISIIPTILVYLLAGKYIIRGMIMGALKK